MAFFVDDELTTTLLSTILTFTRPELTTALVKELTVRSRRKTNPHINSKLKCLRCTCLLPCPHYLKNLKVPRHRQLLPRVPPPLKALLLRKPLPLLPPKPLRPQVTEATARRRRAWSDPLHARRNVASNSSSIIATHTA